jgi:hypothetical protein
LANASRPAYVDGSRADFIARVDRHLATLTDDGDKATFLNGCLDKVEKNFRKLSDWAAAADGTPNPLGDGVNAFDLNDTIIEVHARLLQVRERIRARITDAEAAIPPLPYVHDRSHPNGFRVISGGRAHASSTGERT